MNVPKLLPSSKNQVPSVYQFNVSLQNLRPKIWRRIQVPADYSLHDLHLAILDAMNLGKCGCGHLYTFETRNTSDDFDFDDMKFGEDKYGDERMADHFLFPNDKAEFTWDLGDSWDHDIVLESIEPAIPGIEYPRCIAGQTAMHPEHPSEEQISQYPLYCKNFSYKEVTFPRARKWSHTK